MKETRNRPRRNPRTILGWLVELYDPGTDKSDRVRIWSGAKLVSDLQRFLVRVSDFDIWHPTLGNK